MKKQPEGKKMFVNERFNSITEYLKERKRASVTELSNVLYVSPATVRRDLLEMQKMGLVARTHGGALYLDNSDEVSIFVRLEKDSLEKELTASVALDRIPPFQTVFIDNSSTCLALAERMDLSHKTIVTNGLQIASKLSSKHDVNIIMPGGELHYNTNAVTGSLACNQLRSFKFDLSLCSCAAIDTDSSYEFSLETIQIKKVAMEQSKLHVLVVSESKFTRTAPYVTCGLSAYHAIMTNAPDEVVEPLREAGLRVYNKPSKKHAKQ